MYWTGVVCVLSEVKIGEEWLAPAKRVMESVRLGDPFGYRYYASQGE